MLHIGLVSHMGEDHQKIIKDMTDCELYYFHSDRDALVKKGDIIEIVYGNVRQFELAQMTALKWIQTTWAGVENLMYPEMVKSDVMITNLRGQRATSMSEQTIGGILYFTREFHRHVKANQEGRFINCHHQFHLEGSTACVLGAGAIARVMIPKLQALGIKVLGVNTTGKPTAYCPHMYTLETIREELPKVDHVISCLPATTYTNNYINKEFLIKLKKGARFINISRGAVVNEADLVECIENGQISGAMLDVSNPEPPPEDSLLWKNPKILFTAHSSFKPYSEPGTDGFTIFKKNLAYYIAGEKDKMVNVVNKDLGY
ncbi:D-2-hydroxyacid dehydrogenase [Spirochaetota bacterium]